MNSSRRLKQVQYISLVTFVVSIIWLILCRRSGQGALCVWVFGSSVSFLIAYVLTRLYWFSLARILYILAFNVGVTVTASYVGKPGNVELLLIFAIGLPFLMFSFRRERILVVLCAMLPITAWVLLFVTDFNLVTHSKIDPGIASKVFYPFSFITTVILIAFETTYFSILNSGYYNRIQQKRIDAEEASTAKSRFLSTMSHEIRTPLNAIIGLSHILQKNGPRDDQKENVEALNYSGKLLLQLLNNVLDYSKMEAKEFVLDPIPTNLNQAFNQLHKIHEPNCIKKGISIEVNLHDNIPMVWLDVVRFNQVLNNLINNAIKFTDEGGVYVGLQIENKTEETLELSVEVSDTGRGIAEDKLDSIFEAFKQEDNSTQRVYGGTGLGLSIVKEIVEHMDSNISVTSKPGYGSTFSFTLKLNRVSSEEIASMEHRAEHQLDGVRVLLVEDNAINEMVGRQILEREGLIVDSTENGELAVNKVRENTYDIVLMDIQMPVMDGYEASRQIRMFNSDIPILALSASVFMEVKDKIFKSGMNGFVFKPFDPESLFDRIASALKEAEELVEE
ncbi:MAG: response regulator [Bacteroidetes bacterium]|nr:response regulator [Bacteroidota bacterium]